MSYGADDIQVVAGRNEMSRKDWIRYDGHFIYVEKLPGGGYHLDITDKMPDNVLVRDMLVAATFEGTFIEQAPIISKENNVSLFKPTPEEQAARAKTAANLPWPVKVVMLFIEIALYILLGGLALAIIAAPIAGIIWLAGKLF